MVLVSLLNNVLPFVTARGETGNDIEQRDEIIRLLLDSTGEGIYGTDMDGVCTFANPACVRLLGFESEQDLLGKNMHQLVHHTRPNGEPYPMSECQIYRAFREQVGVHVDDEVMFCADGAAFPAEYWSYPVTRDDELVGCVLTFTDIRERRAAEDELQQQHDLVRLLLDSTAEGIYGIDLDGNCTFANPACVEVLGFDFEQDLLGQQMHKLVHHTLPNGEPYPVEQCQIYKAFWEHTGVHVDDEVMFCKNGTSFEAEYWSYPIEKDGELLGCVLTFVDITERRAAERAIRQQEELVRLLLQSTGEGLYGFDLDGNCTFANDACVRLLGFESDQDLLGRQMHKLVHHHRPNGEPYPVEQCQIYKALQVQTGVHVDDELMFCADGSSFPAEYWSYPMFQDGELIGCVLTFVDITERKRIEAELARQHQELEVERAKSEALLLNILPESIADELKAGTAVIADGVSEVTVLFADIVNFTPLTASVTPQKLVGLLDRIFSAFDDLADRLGLEKIKTIGDAYMAVAGVPEHRPDHAQLAAEMALTMIENFEEDCGEDFPGLELRVGMDSGPVVAGVIGKRKFTYDIWGDTVNVASRMESAGLPNHIQVTDRLYERLRDEYQFESRGMIPVKGKGEMQTYFLRGRL
jgi:PAS domain S-box-containing protein